jgi:hypothetical protein
MSARQVPQPIRIATHAYERSVMVTCNCCPHTVEATIRTATQVSDEECDRILSRDLAAEGWHVDEHGECCPECTQAGHHRGDA